jgi:hypothetical protein
MLSILSFNCFILAPCGVSRKELFVCYCNMVHSTQCAVVCLKKHDFVKEATQTCMSQVEII